MDKFDVFMVLIIEEAAVLLNKVINVHVSSIARFHHHPVCIFDLSDLTFVLQDLAPLLSQELFLFLRDFPMLFLLMVMEVGLNLEETAMQFELLMAHVEVILAERLPSFVSLALLFRNIFFLFRQVAHVLSVAVIILKLNMVGLLIVSIFIIDGVVTLMGDVVHWFLNMGVGPVVVVVLNKMMVVIVVVMMGSLTVVVLLPVVELLLLVSEGGVMVLVSDIALVAVVTVVMAWALMHFLLNNVVVVDWSFNHVLLLDYIVMMDWSFVIVSFFHFVMVDWVISVLGVLSLHVSLSVLLFPELVGASVLLVLLSVDVLVLRGDLLIFLIV